VEERLKKKGLLSPAGYDKRRAEWLDQL